MLQYSCGDILQVTPPKQIHEGVRGGHLLSLEAICTDVQSEAIDTGSMGSGDILHPICRGVRGREANHVVSEDVFCAGVAPHWNGSDGGEAIQDEEQSRCIHVDLQ